MAEAVRSNVNVPGLLVFLGFLVVVGVYGLWDVRKTSGRSLRDLAVLAAAITLIVLMVAPMLFFREQMESPDIGTRKLTQYILVAVYLPIAVAITWAFNKLAKRNLRRKKHEGGNSHLAKGSNSDSR
jgi:UDP-N-acetylmuramyl pentapeptide phosphotransferase/UDP-N-acetylglucosamine-1-phosphate transferase